MSSRSRAGESIEQRVQRGETLEATDHLTEEYKELLAGLVGFTANSEIMGAFSEAPWVPKAPGYREKLTLAAKVQDEVGHAQMQYRLCEDLGYDREEMLQSLFDGEAGFGNAFHYPTDEWIDIALIAWLVDGAAMQLQGSLLKTSYGPYARIMQRICREEEFHVRHGQHVVREYATGSKAKQENLQAGIDRWWDRAVMFFGHSDGQSETAKRMMELGIKPKTNDELRQQFFDEYVPKIRELGMTVPDDQIEYDEDTGRWHYTEPDWEEFERVKKGELSAAQERIDRRSASFADTEWVREALEAYHGGEAGRMANGPAAGGD